MHDHVASMGSSATNAWPICCGGRPRNFAAGQSRNQRPGSLTLRAVTNWVSPQCREHPMQFEPKQPPREFMVGFGNKGVIRDCGTMRLEPDEQITFKTEDGKEYDVTRKEWGFYAGPSLNGRLATFNLRAVLVKNRLERFFVLLVARGKEESFKRYVAGE